MGTFVIFALIMLVTMTVSGIIGFAGSVIALPLLSQILDLTTVVAVLSLSGFIQATVPGGSKQKTNRLENGVVYRFMLAD